MKGRLLFFILVVCFSINKSYSQSKTLANSFEIIGDYDKSKLAFYEASILNANMEQYRLREKNVIVNFKEGFECIFYSAKRLSAKGMNIQFENYPIDFVEEFTLPVFSINSNGSLAAAVPMNKNHK